MANAKVTLNGNTLIDLTDTTATASDVALGKVMYAANGVRTVGTASPGLPSGGSTGEILTKASSSDYDAVWSSAPVLSVNGKFGVITLIPSDINAIAAPAAPSSGQVLMYNGSIWTATNVVIASISNSEIDEIMS